MSTKKKYGKIIKTYTGKYGIDDKKMAEWLCKTGKGAATNLRTSTAYRRYVGAFEACIEHVEAEIVKRITG